MYVVAAASPGDVPSVLASVLPSSSPAPRAPGPHAMTAHSAAASMPFLIAADYMPAETRGTEKKPARRGGLGALGTAGGDLEDVSTYLDRQPSPRPKGARRLDGRRAKTA